MYLAKLSLVDPSVVVAATYPIKVKSLDHRSIMIHAASGFG